MTLPNSFIVGVNKAGTTAIFSALVRLPDVHGSRTKETHYFDAIKYGRPLPPLAEYTAQFEGWEGQPVVLEATPGYFYGGAALAAHIHAIAPKGRVVVVLRDPRDRAFSWWRFCKARLMLPGDLSFGEYIDRCEALGLNPETDETAVGWRALSGGRYAEWLVDWQAEFGEDLLVEFYENLVESPTLTLKRIAHHFGSAGVPSSVRTENVSTEIVSRKLQRRALGLNRRLERLWRRFPALKQTLRSVYYKVNASPSQEELSADLRRRLTGYFADSNKALFDLGLDVPASWERTG